MPDQSYLKCGLATSWSFMSVVCAIFISAVAAVKDFTVVLCIAYVCLLRSTIAGIVDQQENYFNEWLLVVSLYAIYMSVPHFFFIFIKKSTFSTPKHIKRADHIKYNCMRALVCGCGRIFTAMCRFFDCIFWTPFRESIHRVIIICNMLTSFSIDFF